MYYDRDDKLFEKTPTNDTEEEFRNKWADEQKKLKKQLISDDTEPWQQDFALLHYIGGVDVSFVKTSTTLACASLVVCDFPELSVVYSDCELVQLDTPYIPGFLAFREVGFFLKLLQKLKDNEPGLLPQVILVDGNGILHPRGFGIASHLGVLSDIPSVGVAKTLMHVDGIAKDEHFASKVNELLYSGDTFPLVAESGQTIGMALRGGCKSSNPIFVSVGHRVSLATAVKLACRCCRYRVAEPVRQADIRSREFLREKFPETSPTCKQQKKDASTRDRKRANKERRHYYANETRVGGAKSITCFLDEDSDEESNLASLFDQI